MSLPYFLADDPASGVLTGAEAKHAHVKRIEPGEHIMLIDGQGSTAVTRVTSVTPSRVDGVVEKQTRVPQPSPRVTVVQAVPKGERDLAMEGMFEGKEIVETLTLEEIDGRTCYSTRSRFDTIADRDIVHLVTSPLDRTRETIAPHSATRKRPGSIANR